MNRRKTFYHVPKHILDLAMEGACLHEAGHAVAAVELGSNRVIARVWRWNPSSWKLSPPIRGNVRYEPMSDFNSAITGIAGCVAEQIAAYPNCVLAENIEFALRTKELEPSASDWRSIRQIHHSRRLEVIQAAIDILSSNWALVQNVIGHLKFDYHFTGWEGSVICTKETIRIKSPLSAP